MIIQNQKTFFPHELAEKKAKMLNDTEKMFNDNYEWTYIVKPISQNHGYSIIEVYEEENEFVAYWEL